MKGLTLASSNGRYGREIFRVAGRYSGWWSGSMKSGHMRQPQNLKCLDNTDTESDEG